MSLFCMTRLNGNHKIYCNSREDLYEAIYRATNRDHELAEEMADWAENAPFGDNWTSGDIDVRVLEREE